MIKSNAFQTPPLRVSRPVSACLRCRTAKIKCDGELPSCSACEKAGRAAECSGANNQFARGKERNYVSSLEVRVEKLARQLEEARRRKISVTMLDLDSKKSAGPRSITKTPKAQRKEASHVDDLVSDFGFLSVNATARDFHGFTKDMSFARLVLYTSSLEKMPRATGLPLPARFVVLPLIQRYLDEVQLLYPFLSETNIFAFLAELQGGHEASPMAHWVVRMVIAISLASTSRRRGDKHYLDAVGYAAEALRFIEAVIQPGSIHCIQSLLLLVVYAMLDPHHFNSWYLIGMASRVMVDLGLHQDLPKDTQTPKPQLDLRRRIYHCVYALDRAISLAHRRAFSFTDDSANVSPQSPFDEASFSNSSEPSGQLLRLRKIQSVAYQRLHLSIGSGFENGWHIASLTVEQMRSWAENLSDTTSQPLRWLFLSELNYGYILTYSSSEFEQKCPSYAKACILEHAEQYTQCMSCLLQMTEPSALYTSHDVLRASYIGDKLLDIIETEDINAISEIYRAPPSPSPETSSLPLLPRRSVIEALDLTLSCFNRLAKVLQHLGVQYGYTEPHSEFHQKSLGPIRALNRQRLALGVKNVV